MIYFICHRGNGSRKNWSGESNIEFRKNIRILRIRVFSHVGLIAIDAYIIRLIFAHYHRIVVVAISRWWFFCALLVVIIFMIISPEVFISILLFHRFDFSCVIVVVVVVVVLLVVSSIGVFFFADCKDLLVVVIFEISLQVFWNAILHLHFLTRWFEI